jgi:hypothetical protein
LFGKVVAVGPDPDPTSNMALALGAHVKCADQLLHSALRCCGAALSVRGMGLTSHTHTPEVKSGERRAGTFAIGLFSPATDHRQQAISYSIRNKRRARAQLRFFVWVWA